MPWYFLTYRAYAEERGKMVYFVFVSKYLRHSILFASVCLTYACSKEVSRTVTGRILKASDSTPISQTSFRLFYETNKNLRKVPHDYPFTTDDSGRFSVQYSRTGIHNGQICFPLSVSDNCFGAYGFGYDNPSVDVGDLYVDF
jgi:hypothetical protein